MIQQGKYNLLYVTRKTQAGYWLTDDEGNEAILFQRETENEIPAGTEMDVFVYSDAENPFIATLKKPALVLNEFGYLECLSVNSAGAFLNWGIDKDLFVPFREQAKTMEEGKSYLVYLYFDEISQRLTASGKFNKFFEKENITLQPKEEVSLMVADQTELGFNAIINNRYKGLIYRNEIFRPLHTGDRIKGYVKQVREDGKIDLRLQKEGFSHTRDNETIILEKLKEKGGFLPLGDDSSPDEISIVLGISKKSFKKTIGALYKKRLISLEKTGIKLVEGK
ncbi:MAG: S1 RNA-binding domain-containing protein [Bacteroidota bacterium]